MHGAVGTSRTWWSTSSAGPSLGARQTLLHVLQVRSVNRSGISSHDELPKFSRLPLWRSASSQTFTGRGSLAPRRTAPRSARTVDAVVSLGGLSVVDLLRCKGLLWIDRWKKMTREPFHSPLSGPGLLAGRNSLCK